MVKSNFTKTWNRSIQPRKQRRYRYEAPLHIKQKFLHVHLSADLRKKYGLRNVQVRKGDKVKILRGSHKKKEGKVERVNLGREHVFVTGVEIIKREGTKVPSQLSPSNLMIIELNLSDKKRKKKLEASGVNKNINKQELEKKSQEDKK
tara:strand:- start:141 stop:584 length:444 start_codon:yes stop_codon:yes gene_type:complete